MEQSFSSRGGSRSELTGLRPLLGRRPPGLFLGSPAVSRGSGRERAPEPARALPLCLSTGSGHAGLHPA